MSTFLELKNECLAYGFNANTYSDRIGAWLNEAQLFIYKQTDARGQTASQIITTAGGVSEYALPSDFARFIDLTNTTDQNHLSELDLREFDDLAADSGKPYGYVILGTSVNLYPSPDGAYALRMRYYKLPALMSGDSDVPELPSEYHHLLETYALYKAYRSEDDMQMAQFYRTEFDRDLGRARGELQSDSHGLNKQVAGAWATSSYSGPVLP